jgi:hypothetical protein
LLVLVLRPERSILEIAAPSVLPFVSLLLVLRRIMLIAPVSRRCFDFDNVGTLVATSLL